MTQIPEPQVPAELHTVRPWAAGKRHGQVPNVSDCDPLKLQAGMRCISPDHSACFGGHDANGLHCIPPSVNSAWRYVHLRLSSHTGVGNFQVLLHLLDKFMLVQQLAEPPFCQTVSPWLHLKSATDVSYLEKKTPQTKRTIKWTGATHAVAFPFPLTDEYLMIAWRRFRRLPKEPVFSSMNSF